VHRCLTDLRNALLQHHKILLDSEKESYEHEVAKITSTNQYLGLVIQDPWFAWLHELSQLIVLIDETQENKKVPVTADDAARLLAQSKSLLIPAEEGNDFGQRYYQAMQRDPDIIIAHGRLMKLMAGLSPYPQSPA
jgi:hypothetical protein